MLIALLLVSICDVDVGGSDKENSFNSNRGGFKPPAVTTEFDLFLDPFRGTDLNLCALILAWCASNK